MKSITVKGREYLFNPEDNSVNVISGRKQWKQRTDFDPLINVLDENNKIKTFYFKDAEHFNCVPFENGVGYGIRADYHDWIAEGKKYQLHLRTLIWVHKTTGRLYFELIPIKEIDNISEIRWPVPYEWKREDENSYTLFPNFMGMMIPSNWDTEICNNDYYRFCEAGANMPWYSQVDHTEGYITILETPYDCNYRYYHPAQDGPTEIFLMWKPSLGKIGYRRVVHTQFISDCDYVKVCKTYRSYVKEQGKLLTLAQKRLENAKIDDLIGSPIIHTDIYYDVRPEAVIYDKEHPENNYRFSTFSQRKEQLRQLKESGLGKAYLHLDGWGKDGYDHLHPDILPPCEKAGGAKDFADLQNFCKENNILFALHDQYRDYYIDAETYDENNSVQCVDGTVEHECTWNGGDQSYLCQMLAPYYIARNYDSLNEMGINPDGVYLDVFSCVHLDECSNPEHTMTQKECIEFRQKSMALLAARGMIISSEVAVDSFLPYLVLCHHTPYRGARDDLKSWGIYLPLFNLVYHDCFIVPWTMRDDKNAPINENRYLDAILNGDPAYLDINADKDEIKKIEAVSSLQKELCLCEMVSHEFVNCDRSVQRTVFSNGTAVTVNYVTHEYKVERQE